MQTTSIFSKLCLTLSLSVAAYAQPLPPSAPPPAAATVAPTPSDAEQAGVRIEVALPANQKVKLGEAFTVTLKVSRPGHVELKFPRKPFLGEGFKLVDAKIEPALPSGDRFEESCTLTAIAVRLGRKKLAAIEIPFKAGEQAGVVTAPAVLLEVQGHLAAEAEPALSGSPQGLPVVVKNWPLIWTLWALGIALVTALLTLVAVRILGPRFRKPAPLPPPRPAHEVAYERLGALQSSGLLEQQEWKQYFFELTEIVRDYLGRRYRISALGDTTSELMDTLRTLQPAGLSMEQIEVFLAEADLVKFAKMGADAEGATLAMQAAWTFVEATREEDKAPAEEPVPLAAARLADARPSARLAALAVDVALYGIAVSAGALAQSRSGQPLWFWVACGGLPFWLLVRDAPSGGSPGRRRAGLCLALDVDGPSILAPLSSRLSRNLVLWLPAVGVIVESVWMAFDPEKRRLGDRIGRTVVLDGGNERGPRPLLLWASVAGAALLYVAIPYWLGSRLP